MNSCLKYSQIFWEYKVNYQIIHYLEDQSILHCLMIFLNGVWNLQLQKTCLRD